MWWVTRGGRYRGDGMLVERLSSLRLRQASGMMLVVVMVVMVVMAVMVTVRLASQAYCFLYCLVLSGLILGRGEATIVQDGLFVRDNWNAIISGQAKTRRGLAVARLI